MLVGDLAEVGGDLLGVVTQVVEGATERLLELLAQRLAVVVAAVRVPSAESLAVLDERRGQLADVAEVLELP